MSSMQNSMAPQWQIVNKRQISSNSTYLILAQLQLVLHTLCILHCNHLLRHQPFPQGCALQVTKNKSFIRTIPNLNDLGFQEEKTEDLAKLVQQRAQDRVVHKSNKFYKKVSRCCFCCNCKFSCTQFQQTVVADLHSLAQ